jgi:hypothetical protein
MNEIHRPLTRRDFVRGTLCTAVGASVLGSSFGAEPDRPARSSRVIVVRDQNALQQSNKVNVPVLEKMLEEVLIRLSGQKTIKSAWLSLLKLDDIVGLVPTPHLNPTHKELVDAIEASLAEAGFPKDRIRNAQGDPGLPEACTALIALPALKAHWLTGMGTVLKNYILYSGKPSDYHGEHNVKLGEIWNLPFVKGKTKLVLVDALRPLCDKGPQVDPRYLWAYNGLMAGTDPVAVETVCLQIITKKREALRGEPWPLSPPPFCVAAADERYHLGTNRMDEIKVESYGWSQDLLI